MYHLVWINSVPLPNNSFARATLSLDIPSQPFISATPQVQILQEVRNNTLLGAVASLGGLLAVFQGLHLMCFGRPLFWGLFGA